MIKIYKTVNEYDKIFKSLPPNQKFVIYKFRESSAEIWYQTMYKTYIAADGRLSDRICQ